MTDHKFTDEDIIKALECCKKTGYNFEECKQCPYGGNCYEGDVNFLQDIVDLINRQRAEIERLTVLAELGNVRANDYRAMRDKAKNARAEAIKEFAERLKEKHRRITDYDEAGFGCQIFIVEEDYIDRLVKEMTEGKPCTEGADCSTCEHCYHDNGYNECAVEGVKP